MNGIQGTGRHPRTDDALYSKKGHDEKADKVRLKKAMKQERIMLFYR